ncbi:MAG TPA: succinate dehydrogenase assembly factor 2 [Dongiaceae bacterium]|nr:succinate dehydrogenase assembly factor 2 [Dongiaceae bacterium]
MNAPAAAGYNPGIRREKAKMAGDSVDNEDEGLRRRLLFQSRHRGVKELDLILGPFAERHLPGFSGAELRDFALLLAEPDPDIYDWLAGRVPLPARLQNRVTSLLLAFRIAGSRP